MNYWNLITGDYDILDNALLSQCRRYVNRKGWHLKTPPVGLAVSVSEAKLWSKIDNSAEDDLIESLIISATLLCEEWTNRAILRQTWIQSFDWIPGSDDFEIYPAGNQNVIEILYYNQKNISAVWDASNYFVDISSDVNPARIVLNEDGEYPNDLRYRASFQVEFEAGYSNAANVPANIKTAIKMIVQNYYEDREGVMTEKEGSDHGVFQLPLRAKEMLAPYKVYFV